MELPPRARPLAPSPRRAALIGWLIALLALLPHLRGVRNGFVYDDFRFVSENGGVQTLAHPLELVTSIERMSTPRDNDIWRPLRTLGFALQHAIGCAQGDGPHDCRDATVYHATSLLLFLLLVRGLIALAQRTTGCSLGVACAGGLLFGVHPLTVESVAWLSSQGDLLAALGVVGTLLLASTRPLAAVGVALLALLSKESALPLVGALALLHARRDALPVRRGVVVAAALATLLYLVARQHLLGRELDFSPAGFSQEAAPLAARAATAARNFLFALRLFLVPWPLSIDYDHSSYEPRAWFQSAGFVLGALALLAGAAITVAMRAARPRAPLLAPLLFAILFFVPTCGLFVVMKSPIADRYLLLPTAGAALLAAAVGARAFQPGRLPARAAPWVTGLAALVLATLTWQRTADFRDDATLWRAELVHHPASLQGQLGLLHAAGAAGDTATEQRLARALLENVAPEDPRGWLAAFRLGQLAVDAGNSKEAVGWFERCRAGLARRGHARGVASELHLAFVGLANVARADQRPAVAEQLAEEGIRWFGRQPRLLEMAGIARDLQGDPGGAVALHEEALAAGGETASLCYHLALAQHHRGDSEAARAAAKRALRLDPAHAGALRLLAELDR